MYIVIFTILSFINSSVTVTRKSNLMKTMHSENPTIVKSIRMQTSLADWIDERANKENRNFSNMVETLLLELLRNETSDTKEAMLT